MVNSVHNRLLITNKQFRPDLFHNGETHSMNSGDGIILELQRLIGLGWHVDASLRPSFNSISSKLQKLVHVLSEDQKCENAKALQWPAGKMAVDTSHSTVVANHATSVTNNSTSTVQADNKSPDSKLAGLDDEFKELYNWLNSLRISSANAVKYCKAFEGCGIVDIESVEDFVVRRKMISLEKDIQLFSSSLVALFTFLTSFKQCFDHLVIFIQSFVSIISV